MTTTESMDSKSEYMSLQNPAGKNYLYTSNIAWLIWQASENVTILTFNKQCKQMFYQDFWAIALHFKTSLISIKKLRCSKPRKALKLERISDLAAQVNVCLLIIINYSFKFYSCQLHCCWYIHTKLCEFLLQIL